MVRFLRAHEVPVAVVHSEQFLGVMLASPAPFVVVDANAGETCLASVINVLARCVGMPRAEVVVVGEARYPASEARLWAAGVNNWYPTARATALLKHWHWTQCINRGEQADVLGVNGHWIRPFAKGRLGYLDVSDGQLNVRIPIVNGRLGFAQIRDFESNFLRAAMREANVGTAAQARTVVLAGRLPTSPVGSPAASSVERSRLYAMMATRERNVLRWLGSTRPTQVTWRESKFALPEELTFDIDELLERDNGGSRFSVVPPAGSRAASYVANDTTLVEVS
jgi:hypothetical protein